MKTQLRAFTAVSLLIVVSTYLLLVRTGVGQRWDDRAYLGGLLASQSTRQDLTAILHRISIPSIALALIAVVAIGFARRRPRDSLITAGAIVGSILTAEILKRVLPRPDLAADLNALVNDSNRENFPSGHATIATAFALGFILISSPALRGIVTLGALLFTAFVPMAAVAAGWHRPSDALGGIALAAGWLGLAALVIVQDAETSADPPPVPPLRRLITLCLVVLGTAVLGTLLWVWLGSLTDIPVTHGGKAFIIGEALIALLAVTVVGTFSRICPELDSRPLARRDDVHA